jgi:choline dehydrogenase
MLSQAQATQILFDDNRASGLSYWRDGQSHEVYASREIILCGGAINSPQLLLLSAD